MLVTYKSKQHFIFRRQWSQLGRKHHKITIAQWNVRTLLDRENTNIPERRTSLVAMELAKYNINIAVLSETRFHASGSLNDLEYTFYWSGKLNGERREAGVGFAIKGTSWQSWQKCHIQWVTGLWLWESLWQRTGMLQLSVHTLQQWRTPKRTRIHCTVI